MRTLIRRFQENRASYVSGPYNETQIRREFVDPLFTALGWDVANASGYAEAYKDVVHEDAIVIGGMTKAPDYSFRVGGARKFFVETKRPAVKIRDDAAAAFQLRRYAWSAKLPLSILTNFAEFSVYDCRVKPERSDPAGTARILYLTCDEYEARWDELAGIFAKESVLKGSFDRYAESTKKKRGTAEVDAAFLKEIEAWREELARNIALRNPGLSQRELNFAVQRTIDRIIFLRICEDRGIEPYGGLQALLNGENVYARLGELFRRADERYNSGLFHFRPEKGRAEPPDELTLGLAVDDKVVKDILRRLYYPDSPYEFSVLPADILGQVYEQFLGKVIRLTPGHRAVVEEKPEVRKAGGVYYTPTYIVDYIVKNTVGELLQGKTSQEVSGFTPNWRPSKKLHPLRVLDPACGSGSFLLGAYQYLLDWYRDRYVEDGAEKYARGRNPRLYRISLPSPAAGRGVGGEGEWRLTTAERKRILLTHIYGVDIDPQAVEVTKLSLLLKVLEGETQETLDSFYRLFQERALPDLGANIKCGNSLIGPDFYETAEAAGLDREELLRINPFDWHAEFPEVFPSSASPSGRGEGEGGGFDAVIGNPPYIRIQALREFHAGQVEYLKRRYHAGSKGNFDIYVLFVERGLELLNKTGRLGFILPNKFFIAKYGEPLRKLLSEGRHVSHIVHFGDQQVFAGGTTYTALLFLDKTGTGKCDFVQVDDLAAWQTAGHARRREVKAERIMSQEWAFLTENLAPVLEKLDSFPHRLRDLTARMFQGLITGADKVFILTDLGDGRFFSAALQTEVALEPALMHPLCKGSVNIRRYTIDTPTKSILFPYRIADGRAGLLSKQELAARYPMAWAYLSANRPVLESRERGKWKHDRWYAFGRSQNLAEMDQVKILTPSIARRASFTLDGKGRFYFVGSGGGGGGGYGLTLRREHGLSYEYVLGLLNSILLDLYLQSRSSRFSGGFYAYNRQYLEQLPIRTIDFSDPADKARHDKMVELVQRMLDLHKQLAAAKTEHEKTALQRQIVATDHQIDRLVYDLYGLTADEIRIVEEGTQE
ncbi:MAG: Eco57I restriction-modification methylase domain-containing protein [Candidatus Bipolaricaulis sp.]|nr:Eco57I restriction-modification methylase domain-containing protein [Candidatus Bipolaricaulis sp.]